MRSLQSFAEAESIYHRALQNEAGNIEALIGLSQVLTDQGKAKQAIAILLPLAKKTGK